MAKPPKNKKGSNQPEITPVSLYSREELSAAIKKIGDLQRQKSELANPINDRIQELQQELETAISPIDREIQELAYGIKNFVDANKSDIIGSERKSAKLTTGTVAYRTKQPKVLTRNTEKLHNELLEKSGLLKSFVAFVKKLSKAFLRVKLELDKDAALASPAEARALGIEIEEGVERFYIKPDTVDEEIEVAA
jgi:phage host-nuclease inhibitor protein Gam